MSVKEYKEWLQKKLDEHKIDRSRLIATIIVVERSLVVEQTRRGSSRSKPFYRLYKDDGEPTRAWIHAAELVLWLKYNDFKADPYVKSVVEYPLVRRMLFRPTRKQLPLNALFPSARKSTENIKSYVRHYRTWANKHY